MAGGRKSREAEKARRLKKPRDGKNREAEKAGRRKEPGGGKSWNLADREPERIEMV